MKTIVPVSFLLFIILSLNTGCVSQKQQPSDVKKMFYQTEESSLSKDSSLNYDWMDKEYTFKASTDGDKLEVKNTTPEEFFNTFMQAYIDGDTKVLKCLVTYPEKVEENKDLYIKLASMLEDIENLNIMAYKGPETISESIILIIRADYKIKDCETLLPSLKIYVLNKKDGKWYSDNPKKYDDTTQLYLMNLCSDKNIRAINDDVLQKREKVLSQSEELRRIADLMK